MLLIQNLALRYKSNTHTYKTSELFETTAQTNRVVYDIAVVFGQADKMQDLASKYGSQKLGIYMISTSEKWDEVIKYKYDELQERFQTKPASIVCVYQTDVKDWCIFYPSYLEDAIAEPQGYFNHVHDLLSKMDLANSYANIVNYTYELYPDLNELVTQAANKYVQQEQKQDFIRESIFYFIQLISLQILVGLATGIVQKDYIYASNTQLFSHIKDEIEADKAKVKSETDKNVRKFDAEAQKDMQNIEIPEWIRYKNLTPKVMQRLSRLSEQLDNSDINSNTARLVDRLDELDSMVSQRYTKEDDKVSETPQFIKKFYRQYFLMLMNLIEQMEKYVNENDLQKLHSYNEGIELYEQITTNVVKKLKQQGIDTIKISVDAIKRGALMDGLIDEDSDRDNKKSSKPIEQNQDNVVSDAVENSDSDIINESEKQDNTEKNNTNTEENVDEHQ